MRHVHALGAAVARAAASLALPLADGTRRTAAGLRKVPCLALARGRARVALRIRDTAGAASRGAAVRALDAVVLGVVRSPVVGADGAAHRRCLRRGGCADEERKERERAHVTTREENVPRARSLGNRVTSGKK